MVAQAYATPEVLARLTDEQRGELLGRWSATMRRTAELLAEVWRTNDIDRSTLIVRRGNDSSTWNLVCGAYNTARAGWLACLAATGATDLLDAMCPGKAMVLIAADLAAWHRSTGGGPHPDIMVWARLPLPWQVLAGWESCTRDDVAAACRDAGLGPEATGWIAPRPPGRVATFTPTPELVHGVAIADPLWATLRRNAGVFSGKHIRSDYTADLAGGIPRDVVTGPLPDAPQPDGRDRDR